jgi:hypothetical protein
VDNLDDVDFMLIGDLNHGCSASSIYFTNECHALNFNPSPSAVSVLKIRFLRVKLLKIGKSEQVRWLDVMLLTITSAAALVCIKRI